MCILYLSFTFNFVLFSGNAAFTSEIQRRNNPGQSRQRTHWGLAEERDLVSERSSGIWTTRKEYTRGDDDTGDKLTTGKTWLVVYDTLYFAPYTRAETVTVKSPQAQNLQ